MNNKYTYILLVLVVIALVYIVPRVAKTPDNQAQIVDFETCIAAGNAVMESYPRQCRTDNGQNFVEDVDPLEQTEVIIATPRPQTVVFSPLAVSGQARGTWFFEANIPVVVTDANGNILGQAGLQAIGDWMTEDFVDFSGTVEFSQPTTTTGFLIVAKDNPSGLPENDDSVTMPIRFQ